MPFIKKRFNLLLCFLELLTVGFFLALIGFLIEEFYPEVCLPHVSRRRILLKGLLSKPFIEMNEVKEIDNFGMLTPFL